MGRGPRKLAFVLASSDHGAMIVNRLDYRMTDETRGYGVGYQLLETGQFESDDIHLVKNLLAARRTHHGDGVVVIDCGANIGVHTIDWATSMTNWGSVVAIEAQERIYYALAGNIALNNCFNAVALHAAVSSESGSMEIPNPNYLLPASFGSLELRQSNTNEFIGQPVSYNENTVTVRKLALDEFGLQRVDFIKIDVEGMEFEVLDGAKKTLQRSHPMMFIEKIKSDAGLLRKWLTANGYSTMDFGMNILAIHSDDPALAEIKVWRPDQSH